MKGYCEWVLERDKIWTIEGLSRVASRKETKDCRTKGMDRGIVIADTRGTMTFLHLSDLALIS